MRGKVLASQSGRWNRENHWLSQTKRGIKISGNTIHDNGAGIYLHETKDSVVSGNFVYSNAYILHIIEKNDCYKARLSGIELSIDTGNPPFGSNNNIIRYNVVHDDGTHGIFTNYVPSEHNKILYNVIYTHPQGSCIMANYLGHEIHNNTCYKSQIGVHLYVSSTTQKTGNISVENNLFLRNSKFQVLIEKGAEGPVRFLE